MRADRKRVFVAIDFPDSVIREVARVQGILGKLKFTGKLTELENIHLTLKFLGEISKDRLELVRGMLKKIKLRDFEVKLGNVGIFSFRGKPRIVWVKVMGKGIFDLQRKVDEILKSEGFELEKRFMSHMTIARVKYVKSAGDFRKYIEGIKLKDVRFKVDEFKLLESELMTIGPVYRELERYELKI
jgi:RNA 2',3'-cyclic 3'-phosphodiesterase